LKFLSKNEQKMPIFDQKQAKIGQKLQKRPIAFIPF
jgi:hypothetical protein